MLQKVQGGRHRNERTKALLEGVLRLVERLAVDERLEDGGLEPPQLLQSEVLAKFGEIDYAALEAEDEEAERAAPADAVELAVLDWIVPLLERRHRERAMPGRERQPQQRTRVGKVYDAARGTVLPLRAQLRGQVLAAEPPHTEVHDLDAGLRARAQPLPAADRKPQRQVAGLRAYQQDAPLVLRRHELFRAEHLRDAFPLQRRVREPEREKLLLDAVDEVARAALDAEAQEPSPLVAVDDARAEPERVLEAERAEAPPARRQVEALEAPLEDELDAGYSVLHVARQEGARDVLPQAHRVGHQHAHVEQVRVRHEEVVVAAVVMRQEESERQKERRARQVLLELPLAAEQRRAPEGR